mgnify:CR=1 FL=1
MRFRRFFCAEICGARNFLRTFFFAPQNFCGFYRAFVVINNTMKWEEVKFDKKLAEDLGAYLGVSPILGALILQRGYNDLLRAKMFMRPKLADLDDPFRVKNLRRAVLRIIEAIEKRESVLVFGDYDVDGITSTTLLVSILRHFGISPTYFVPRRMEEGYGLSEAALERALSGGKPQLLIALDCGTNAVDAINYIRSKDIDLIVVDHHQAKDVSADDHILINPHVHNIGATPWNQLCTVGLVFKLAHGLIKEMRQRNDARSWEINLKDYLDLVALGTVADLVPLVDENRIMSRYGIKRLKSTRRTGIQALIQASGIALGEDITPIDISFKLGPRINASGRLADASLPLEMLLGDDFTTCYRAACELNDINKERQEIERGVLEDAMKQVEAKHLDKYPCIVVYDPSWHPGVVGIIAGKLSRDFHKPVIVFGEIDEGYTKGSGRSILGIDLVECLAHCGDILGSWGGHPMAVGVAVKEGCVDLFREKISETINKKYGENIDFTPGVTINLTLDVSDVGLELLDELELLHPYGEGNREPIFALKGIELAKPVEVFGSAQNYRFQIPLGDSGWISAVAWRGGDRLPPVGKPIDLAVKLGWNRWNKRKTPQATLIDWRESES